MPLFDWFYVVFQLAKTRTDITAKQIERVPGISYPTALCMCNMIRKRLEETPEQMTGTVEADETYLGNSRRYFGRKRKRGRGADKHPVIGIMERGGKVVPKVVPSCKRDMVFPTITQHVAEGAEVLVRKLMHATERLATTATTESSICTNRKMTKWRC